ncbi:helix-turn-helix domain-containing protein [Sphingomonas cavernae]|nr:AraC family transcriptional regulator [Sphingomonas cavernae]
MDMSLTYAAPDADLSAYITAFYEFRADVPRFEAGECADYAQIRFGFSGSGTCRFADGHIQQLPVISIIGPTTGNTNIRAEGPIHLFGAGLLPAGWGALMGFEASMLVNRAVDATGFFGKTLDGIMERLLAAPTVEDKAVIASALFRELIQRDRQAALAFTRSVDAWLAASPSPRVDDLVAVLGLSRRQVERLCKRYYGAPPKMLARKYRALRAAASLALGEGIAGDIMAENFYDQSHFIKEIKQFTGITPTRFGEALPVLAQLKRGRVDIAGPTDPLFQGS